jgi:hypothetical protein
MPKLEAKSRYSRLAVAAAVSIASLLVAGSPPSSASPAAGWDFYDASPSCGNLIRKVHVSGQKSATVERRIVRARAGHQLAVTDARPRKILFTDFNCKTKRTTVKLARVGDRVTVTALTGPMRASPHASFSSSGPRAFIGWNSAGAVRLNKVTLTGTVVARRSWSGIGWLEGIDSGGSGGIYLHVSEGFGESVRVLKLSTGSHLVQRFEKSNEMFMHMSVSSSDVLAMATSSSPGRVFFRGRYPFKRVGICGDGSPQAFTWLAHRVALAACFNVGYSYQILDLRQDRPVRTRLGRFWGIRPVGLG